GIAPRRRARARAALVDRVLRAARDRDPAVARRLSAHERRALSVALDGAGAVCRRRRAAIERGGLHEDRERERCVLHVDDIPRAVPITAITVVTTRSAR